jgi:hypothetical protein
MPGDTGIGAIVGTGSQGATDLFITMYKFLVSSGSTVAGIKLIANNFGSVPGSGFNYWNQTNPVGNNAWSVFCFTSASIPFYMLLQFGTSSIGSSEGGVIGQPPGNPGSATNNASNYTQNGGVGIQFAMRSDGGNPWTGTTGALGADTKSNPVWTTGSNYFDPAAAFVWPRCNSVSGSGAVTLTSGSRAVCLTIAPQAYMNGINASGMRLHLACNFDNIAIARDMFSTVGNYNYMWFGKYTTFTGSWPQNSSSVAPAVPYAMLWRELENASPTIAVGTANVYGSTSGDSEREGGIAHPFLSGQVVGCSVDAPANLMAFNAGYQPNTMYSTPLTYDEFPMVLYINEVLAPDRGGSTPPLPPGALMGQTDYLRFNYGLFVGDIGSGSNGVTADASVGSLRIVLGSSPTTANVSKYSFPWSQNIKDSFLSGGSGSGSRTGSYF